ncbi:MAG: hypothetical protein CL610_30370 [Anaerolineaceae bacterium]|nr:hypothetical protein [Anaerolineaceae bacterium]
MSKSKMVAARELIREKKYEEARSLLKTVDHPTAIDWILKIDSVLAAKDSAKTSKKKPRKSFLRMVFESVIITIAGLLCIIAVLPSLSISQPPLTQGEIDVLATTVAQIPTWQKWHKDGSDYYVTLEDTGIGLRYRDKFAQIGRAIVEHEIGGIRRIILIYSFEGFTTGMLTANVSDIRAFVNGDITEDQFEVRIKIE